MYTYLNVKRLFQELRDDYLEMREGLDIGNNVNSTMLVAVLGNPWFTNRYVYWCLSALLLSWPLRVIIEYKTQYVDYQVNINHSFSLISANSA